MKIGWGQSVGHTVQAREFAFHPVATGRHWACVESETALIEVCFGMILFLF